jgi:hypothetical protein
MLLVLSLSTVAVPPAMADLSAPEIEVVRSQPEGAETHGATAGDANQDSRQRLLLAGLSGMKFLPDGGTIDSQSHPTLLPWTGLGGNALGMFSGSNAILHLSAVAGTFLIIKSGLDTQVHNDFARNTLVGKYSSPGVVFGALVPVLLGGGLLGSGLTGGSSQLVSAGSAVLQASLLAVCYSSALKALTGRPHPGDHHELVIYDDNTASETFRFGFLRGGAFWGWPSGHMLANTAAVASLLTFYKDKTWLDIAGGAYLGYLFLSVISHGRSSMHWFSDAVAGTLMGYAIGSTVGRDFRRRWENKKDRPAGLTFSAAPQLFAVSFSIEL